MPPPLSLKTPKAHTRTFHDYFKPVYYSGKIIGLFHYTYSDVVGGRSHNENTKSSITRKVQSFCSSVPFIIFCICHFGAKMRELSGKCWKDTTFGGKATAIYCFVKFSIDYVWFIYKRKEVAEILDRINSMAIKLDYDFTGKTLKLQTITFFFGVLTFRIICVIITANQQEPSGEASTGLSGCWDEIIIIAIINFITFSITGSLRRFFAELNARLKRIITTSDDNVDDALLEINKTAELHFELVEISSELNATFSWPVLGNALALFILITVYTYHMILEIKQIHVNSVDFGTVLEFSVDIGWELFLVCNFGFMVNSWDELSKEANATGLYVHEIWNKLENDLEKSTVTIKQQQKIDQVSLQLLQTKLKFTLCRMMDLDRTLIHEVLQTVTMYLIWILQLQT